MIVLVIGLAVLVAMAVMRVAVEREYDDYAPPVARAVLRVASWLLPSPIRARHLEEWQSALYESRCAGHGAGLIRALGLVVAAAWLAIFLRWTERSTIYRLPRAGYLAIALGLLSTLATILAQLGMRSWLSVALLPPCAALLYFLRPASVLRRVNLDRTKKLLDRDIRWTDQELERMNKLIAVAQTRDLTRRETSDLVKGDRAFARSVRRRLRQLHRRLTLYGWLIGHPGSRFHREDFLIDLRTTADEIRPILSGR